MILTDKPRKKTEQSEEQLQLLSVAVAALPKERLENWEVFCYFSENQTGPAGFERSTLLSLSIEYSCAGFLEGLNQYVLPKGSFYFDKANNRMFLKPQAVHIARESAKEYMYTIIG